MTPKSDYFEMSGILFYIFPYCDAGVFEVLQIRIFVILHWITALGASDTFYFLFVLD